MSYRRLFSSLLVFVLAVSVSFAGGFNPARVDDFESGTTEGWVEGATSPNPPVNVSSGGPAGGTDNYLSNTSSGAAGAGGRMAMFNLEWAGDWLAAQADMVSLDARNLGGSSLTLRIAIGSNSGNWYASNDSYPMAASGAWMTGLMFDLSDMSGVGSPTETLSQVLADVAEFRIISSSAIDFRGELVNGVMGVDNVEVLVVPVEVQSFSID